MNPATARELLASRETFLKEFILPGSIKINKTRGATEAEDWIIDRVNSELKSYNASSRLALASAKVTK